MGEERLAWTIDCMFACVERAQQRIELFSTQQEDEAYDAIVKEDLQEEQDIEDGLLLSMAQILAELIKVYQDDFLSLHQLP